MANPIVRAAVVQAAPVIFDTPRTIAKLVDLTEQAAGQGAEIVVFPEAFVGGYPKVWTLAHASACAARRGARTFGATMKARSPCPGRKWSKSATSRGVTDCIWSLE